MSDANNNNDGRNDAKPKSVPLGEKALKAQSAVSLAAGGFDSYDEKISDPQPLTASPSRPEKREAEKGKSNRSAKKSRKRREVPPSVRAAAPREKKEKTFEKPMKNMTSGISLEERLAYYREKYGDNFKIKNQDSVGNTPE